jgi:hypothetical protein
MPTASLDEKLLALSKPKLLIMDELGRQVLNATPALMWTGDTKAAIERSSEISGLRAARGLPLGDRWISHQLQTNKVIGHFG